jgi:hypothetical protein
MTHIYGKRKVQQVSFALARFLILDCYSLTNASRHLVLVCKLTYYASSVLHEFEDCSISPLNWITVLREPSQNITCHTLVLSLAPQRSTPKTCSQASRLGWQALGPTDSNSPSFQYIQSSSEKISKFSERVHAELDIEVFKHKLFCSEVMDKPRKLVQDHCMHTNGYLSDNKDIVHLRNKKQAKKSKLKGRKKGKTATSPLPSMDSTVQEEWDQDVEEEDNDDEIIISESESCGDS